MVATLHALLNTLLAEGILELHNNKSLRINFGRNAFETVKTSFPVAKMVKEVEKVAKEVVKIFYGEQKSIEAENNWVETFSKGGVPEDVQEITAEENQGLIDVLVENKILSSRGEFRRLVEGGGLKKSDGTQIKDPNVLVENETYKIGKKVFVKIVLK